MIIFLNIIKRLLKNKAQLVIMLVLPLLPVLPIAMGTPSSEQMITVGIADEDRTVLTSAFIDTMKSDCKVVGVEKDNIENGLLNTAIHYAIVIEKGFTERMIKSGDSKLTGYVKEGADLTPLVRSYADSFLNPVKSIAAAAGGNRDKFFSGLKDLKEGPLTIGREMVESPDRTKARSSWGMIIQFMMFSSVFSATLLITDKENKTFFRTLTAAVSMKNYMFQSILGFLTVAVLQVTVLITVSVAGLGVYPGASPFYMFVLLAVFSLVGVSLGIVLSSFSRNTIQASIYGAGIVVLMCVMGGAWGQLPSSGLIANLSKLLPVTWAMESVDKLVDNAGLAGISGNLGILALFAAVFFLLGTWKKADIAK